MHKITIITLFTLILTACGTPYHPDTSYLTEEAIQNHQQVIIDQTEIYNNAEEEVDRVNAAEAIAFSEMTLGNYDRAIELYKEILDFDAVHYPALNNLANMYEEMGDLDSALEYQQRLYNANKGSDAVLKDFVRLLVKAEKYDGAVSALEDYAKSNEDYDGQFLSDEFEYIQKNNPNANVPK